MKIMGVKGIITMVIIMRIMGVIIIFWSQTLLLKKIDNKFFKVRLTSKLTKKAT
jgi:hypothetical protein